MKTRDPIIYSLVMAYMQTRILRRDMRREGMTGTVPLYNQMLAEFRRQWSDHKLSRPMSGRA